MKNSLACEKCNAKCEERHMLTGYDGFTETCWLCNNCFVDEAKKQMYIIEPFTGRAITQEELGE